MAIGTVRDVTAGNVNEMISYTRRFDQNPFIDSLRYKIVNVFVCQNQLRQAYEFADEIKDLAIKISVIHQVAQIALHVDHDIVWEGALKEDEIFSQLAEEIKKDLLVNRFETAFKKIKKIKTKYIREANQRKLAHLVNVFINRLTDHQNPDYIKNFETALTIHKNKDLSLNLVRRVFQVFVRIFSEKEDRLRFALALSKIPTQKWQIDCLGKEYEIALEKGNLEKGYEIAKLVHHLTRDTFYLKNFCDILLCRNCQYFMENNVHLFSGDRKIPFRLTQTCFESTDREFVFIQRIAKELIETEDEALLFFAIPEFLDFASSIDLIEITSSI